MRCCFCDPEETTPQPTIKASLIPEPIVKAIPEPAASTKMAKKVWIVYYSMYGHIKTMSEAYKKGVESVEGVEVKVFQIAETLSEEVLGKMHAPAKPADPVVDVYALPEADAFVFGFPTRFGTLPAQVKAFIDATGQHWQKGTLYQKPYALFTSTATQGGGQESTFISAVNNFSHHGMVFVPGGICCPGTQYDNSEAHGGSAWGPGCLAGGDGSRQPSQKELDHAEAAGKAFASFIVRLA